MPADALCTRPSSDVWPRQRQAPALFFVREFAFRRPLRAIAGEVAAPGRPRAGFYGAADHTRVSRFV